MASVLSCRLHYKGSLSSQLSPYLSSILSLLSLAQSHRKSAKHPLNSIAQENVCQLGWFELQVTIIMFESSLYKIYIFLLRNMETGAVIKLIFGFNNFIKDSSPFYPSVPPTSARRLLTSGFVTS